MWLWTAVGVLLIFEAVIANNQATNGQEMATLQDEQTKLTLQVDDLERQVANSGALQTIQRRAIDDLKLAPVDKNVLYMDTSGEDGR